MGLRDMYAYAIQTAKGKFQGNAEERDGKLYFLPQIAERKALGAADWLCLAASPTFAIMALLTGASGGGPPDMLCSAAQHASPLSGMARWKSAGFALTTSGDVSNA